MFCNFCPYSYDIVVMELLENMYVTQQAMLQVYKQLSRYSIII